MAINIVTGDWKKGATAEYRQRRSEATARRQEAVETIQLAQQTIREADEEIAGLDQGAKAFGLEVVSEPDFVLTAPGGGVAVMQVKPQAPGQFKDVALAVLRESYPKSVKAMHVQQAAEAELGRTFHWKTAGMTLYRLKQDGLAARRGQDWFYVPQPGDPEELV